MDILDKKKLPGLIKIPLESGAKDEEKMDRGRVEGVMFLPKISKAFEMFRSTYGCFCLQMRCLGRMPPFFHCPETVKRCHHNRWQPLPRHFLLALSEQTVITGKSSETDTNCLSWLSSGGLF
ncbi:hypothetical protein CCH79_00012283 [Gambusia affinis]|uniref:Uncharacterized protein n=1 Tax=Gambusia affinis TaxID=33528 RepID=A0A315UTS1_GAMAF|nr:hypothetical protein CCH79_00012283 [Gambusia affinis]